MAQATKGHRARLLSVPDGSEQLDVRNPEFALRCWCSSLLLWEVRSDLTDGKIGRVIFCVTRERMVLLHSFVKRTQKTPARDLRLALRRMKEVL